MRLSLAVLGLLGATTAVGCDASNDSESQTGAPPAYASAEPEAYDQYGAPLRAPNADAVGPDASRRNASEPDDANVAPPARTAPREPPTPPAHVNELFRTPGGNGVSQPSPAPPLANPTSVQTTKPAPPPPPPPHRPRPWGGSDPCPPCGMG
jgi:hypothetical protein